MKITVIGSGHLGATHAAGMAEIGHDVIGVDIDPAKIETLNAGRGWFHEPELDELLARNIGAGRLRFTTDFAVAAEFGDVHFLAVGTPSGTDGAYDLAQLTGAIERLAPLLTRPCLIVGKSTVSPGTAQRVEALARSLAPAGDGVEVAWNPEFLREGTAVADTLTPDRIVLGVASTEAEKILRLVYEPITGGHDCPLVVTDRITAEMVKATANAYLATRISFVNAVAEMCAASGANVAELTEAIGYDARIGHHYFQPGLGFGGGCLPKDLHAFTHQAETAGVVPAARLLRGVDEVNLHMRSRAVELATGALDGSVSGRRIAMWGHLSSPASTMCVTPRRWMSPCVCTRQAPGSPSTTRRGWRWPGSSRRSSTTPEPPPTPPTTPSWWSSARAGRSSRPWTRTPSPTGSAGVRSWTRGGAFRAAVACRRMERPGARLPVLTSPEGMEPGRLRNRGVAGFVVDGYGSRQVGRPPLAGTEPRPAGPTRPGPAARTAAPTPPHRCPGRWARRSCRPRPGSPPIRTVALAFRPGPAGTFRWTPGFLGRRPRLPASAPHEVGQSFLSTPSTADSAGPRTVGAKIAGSRTPKRTLERVHHPVETVWQWRRLIRRRPGPVPEQVSGQARAHWSGGRPGRGDDELLMGVRLAHRFGLRSVRRRPGRGCSLPVRVPRHAIRRAERGRHAHGIAEVEETLPVACRRI